MLESSTPKFLAVANLIALSALVAISPNSMFSVVREALALVSVKPFVFPSSCYTEIVLITPFSSLPCKYESFIFIVIF